LPRVTASLEDLNNTDFEVFRQLSKDKKTQWAMTAHIIFDALDHILPVTISKKAINFIREDIGFKGILISDDICMHALHTGIDLNIKLEFIKSLSNVAKQAFDAGCDLICHCSGDIEEIQAVCNSLPHKEYIQLMEKDNDLL
jgi:beta-glucosidase-like glycosyl hydrolase